MNNLLNPLFIICISTGLIFIIAAIISSKYPPKKINHIYGYRTKNSMKSKERWDFAQVYSMNLMKRYGVYLILLGAVGYFTTFSVIQSTILGLAALIILTVALMYNTEKALKERYETE